MSGLVLGTAGHVDHGKTSLVKALTGVDLDRLPEEKARGITIALGFVPLPLPGGRTAGLVDVPGHERLVRTMVSGASGMDAVLLCVSAVEGVMPQTREHLDVLRLLNVEHLIVVQTMADQVDEELLALAADEIREVLQSTPWSAAPIVSTSAVSRQGLDTLLALIDRLPNSRREAGRPFRLPVDRVFVRRGFGTVVTGTAWEGTVCDGAEVELLPGGARARVRGIHVHGEAVSSVSAGSRAALNLTGVEIGDVGRGLWVVAPNTVPEPHVVDASYTHLDTAPLLVGEPGVSVLHGTREVAARMLPLDCEGLEPGEACFVQLHLAEALPCLPGDRFVVRRTSPSVTLGGGVVLDPWAPVVRRKRQTETATELRRLAQGDARVFLERAGLAGLSEAECRAKATSHLGIGIGERRYADGVVARLRAFLLDALAERHATEPLMPGVNRKAVQIGPLKALDERTFLSFLDAEAATGTVVLEAGRVRLAGWHVVLNPDQEAWRAAVTASAEAAGFDGSDLPGERADRDALVFLLRDRGEIELIAGRVFAASVLRRLGSEVEAFLRVNPTLDPAAFKALTGQSRRTAIPLLEWLDAHGVTRRLGDVRVRGAAVSSWVGEEGA